MAKPSGSRRGCSSQASKSSCSRCPKDKLSLTKPGGKQDESIAVDSEDLEQDI